MPFENHNCIIHASQLRMGDIVRAFCGAMARTIGTCPPVEYTKSDGTVIRVDTSFRPVLNSPEDFRQGFDTMTVYRVSDDYVSFVRPYLHIGVDGSLGACGIEHVDNCARSHGGHWYELLGVADSSNDDRLGRYRY